jgi:hypothetical protein
MTLRPVLVSATLILVSVHVPRAQGSNPALDWASLIQGAIHHSSASRSPASSEVLHAMVAIAVHDAVVAIEGGYEPFTTYLDAAPGADVRAAVAAAAYHTARPRLMPARLDYLDTTYQAYLAGIADGDAKQDGIEVGEAAAEALRHRRQGDGFGATALYQCSATPPPAGEFTPNAGCPGPGGPQPVDVALGRVKPFTYEETGPLLPEPPDMTSTQYLDDFIETRDFGRRDSTHRTQDQTDLAYFWSEHSYVHWNRNLIGLALDRGLDTRDTAALFAMVHTAAADSIIAGFAAKYHYRFWRPLTAIPLADLDPHPRTEPDPTWLPLLSVNHPEYPSAHAFWSTAVTDVVAAFFGTHKITWKLSTSQAAVPLLQQPERSYYDLNSMMRDIDDARVWSGLHWRQSMRQGDKIGRTVARHVVRNFFRRQ